MSTCKSNRQQLKLNVNTVLPKDLYTKKKKKLSKKKKVKLLLDGGGFFIILFNNLHIFRLTGTMLDGFLLITRSSVPVILNVDGYVLSEELVDPFQVNWRGWSLASAINWDAGKVQVRKRGFDLLEAVIKTISKGAAELP